jgi:pimeloyl-ACP methyl ester carboxylesterase
MNYAQHVVDGLHCDVLDITPPWAGDVATIIFHHGVGANSDIWARWVPVLGGSYRIVRFDMRGFGRSAAAARGDRWTFEAFCDDVITIADAVGASRFHFVGESIGGTVGLVLGLAHPERLLSLTVSNAAYRGSSIRNVEHWERVLKSEGPRSWSKMMMASRFREGALPAEAWTWFDEQQARHPVDSIVAGRNALVDADLGQRLRRLDVPVLLLHADGSPFVPVEQMAELHALLPRSQLQIFRNAMHGLPFSHAAECAQTLLAFLAQLRRDR